MSLKKLIKLESIGTFTTLSSVGDSQFRKLTLLYGENGRGKTTLASVLRSLKTGDAKLIQERARLGRSKEPFADILLDSGSAVFRNTAWNRTAATLEIFDSAFVSENVYTGEQVAPENRKSLYQVVIGAPAVALAREVDNLDVESRALAKEIANKERTIAARVEAPLTLEEFLLLPPPANLAQEIAETTLQLNASRQAQQIQTRPELATILVPSVPPGVLELVGNGGQIASDELEATVRKHLLSRTGVGGEQWVAQGVDFLHDGQQCPFCAQDTSHSQVVPRLREFFSAAYRTRANAIKQALSELVTELGDDLLRKVTRRSEDNDAAIAAWSDSLDLKHAKLPTAKLATRWRALTAVLRARLEAQLANPAAAQMELPNHEQQLSDYIASRDEVMAQNEQIQKANAAIGTIKTSVASAKRAELEQRLGRLRNTQVRHAPEVSPLCEALVTARTKKKELEKAKREKREALDSMAQVVLTEYEKAINALLEKFGANFNLTGTKPTFQGGKASSTYQISINNETVDLGGPNDQAGPSFRTALSTGDKSTLALALFLASLSRDAELSKKTVVFDDPITSLDVFRSSATEREITELTSKADQVVVLSHDPFFLKRLFDQNNHITPLVVQIARKAQDQGEVVQAFDIEKYCDNGATQDYFILRTFVESGSSDPNQLRAVGRAIRPYLESQLRYRFPHEFPSGTWLGGFIDKVRDATTEPLLNLKARLSELEAINEYSKKLHHSDDPSKNPVPDAVELRAFARRTIALVQR